MSSVMAGPCFLTRTLGIGRHQRDVLRKPSLVAAMIPSLEDGPALKLLIRWLIVAVALVVAVWIVPGIDASGSGWFGVAVMAAVLGLVNAIIRPIIRLLTLPITAMTLGLFLLVINGFTLWLAAWLADHVFDQDFVVDGFFDAILGGIIVSVVSFVLNKILIDEESA